MAEGRSMAENWWKDATVRARKVEGGYESLFNLDGEELVVNYFSFAETATILEEELGRKPTPEEVEEDARKTAGDPRGALKGLPPAPPLDEDEVGEIVINWARVHTHFLGKPPYLSMEDLARAIEDLPDRID